MDKLQKLLSLEVTRCAPYDCDPLYRDSKVIFTIDLNLQRGGSRATNKLTSKRRVESNDAFGVINNIDSERGEGGQTRIKAPDNDLLAAHGVYLYTYGLCMDLLGHKLFRTCLRILQIQTQTIFTHNNSKHGEGLNARVTQATILWIEVNYCLYSKGASKTTNIARI